MKTFILLSISLVCLGCIQSAPAPAPVPPTPISAPLPPQDSVVTVELGDNIVANIHKYAGDSNTITLVQALTIVVGDNSIVIPAGCQLSYTLTDTTGLITFTPKPRITTKVHGITIHPVVDKIMLTAPSSATAYVTELGMQFHQTIPLDSKPSATVDTRPILYMWTMLDGSCPPCNQAGKELTPNLETLPFHLSMNPPDVDPETELRPCFKWTTPSGMKWKYQGWPGLQPFLDMWRKSQGRPKVAKTLFVGEPNG